MILLVKIEVKFALNRGKIILTLVNSRQNHKVKKMRVIAEIFSFKKLPDKWLAEPEEGVAPEWAAGLHFYVDFDAEATITTIREDINLIYLLRMQNNVHELLQFDTVQKKKEMY